MSKVKVAIHAVWGTKNKIPFLKEDILTTLCKHIHENAKKKNIYIDTINGYSNHLHCLFYLNPVIDLRKTIQLMKGESSRWLSLEFPHLHSFGWADDYFASSVCEDKIEIVRKYIENQKTHHQKTPFEDEIKKFKESMDWSRFNYDS